MKKKAMLTGCVTGALLFTAACNAESDDGLTAEEILANSEEAMEELTSYAMDMETVQEMSFGEDSMELNMTAEAQVRMDPLVLYQNASMDMMGMPLSYDSYFSEEHGFLMEDPMSGGWIKLPESFTDEMLAMADVQTSPDEQLEIFRDNLEEVTVEDEEEFYIVTLKGDGVDNEAMKEQLLGLMDGDMGQMMGDAVDSMDIHEFEYEITIDRETFYTTEANIYTDMTVDDGVNNTNMKQTVHMILGEFNEHDDLEVPADVIENAEEIDESEFMGEF
ncbi:DUF6612 family protein [Alteribacter natronophilus]|uniref:DUF6612 family protein n=1 Tax=Alteribacter natronophilus TaxID=2583810 RepID=UPI00110DFC6B|nr:DUF6612 family protein [Alteribacter natronophilus]TMW71869.1 hypothetical protein FGB90_12730 [Alteribacter natronophilus]